MFLNYTHYNRSDFLTTLNVSVDVDFREACARGQLKKAKKMLKLVQVDEAWFSIGDGFRYACWKGYTKVAKWLFHLNPRPRDWDEDLAYRSTFIFGHFNVAKWLERLHPTLRGNRKRELQLVSFF